MMSAKQKFIKAVEENKFDDYKLADGIVLQTDKTADGHFDPWLHVQPDVDDEDIDRALSGQDIFACREFSVRDDDSIDGKHVYMFGITLDDDIDARSIPQAPSLTE